MIYLNERTRHNILPFYKVLLHFNFNNRNEFRNKIIFFILLEYNLIRIDLPNKIKTNNKRFRYFCT